MWGGAASAIVKFHALYAELLEKVLPHPDPNPDPHTPQPPQPQT